MGNLNRGVSKGEKEKGEKGKVHSILILQNTR
jgi:hypothetical protein